MMRNLQLQLLQPLDFTSPQALKCSQGLHPCNFSQVEEGKSHLLLGWHMHVYEKNHVEPRSKAAKLNCLYSQDAFCNANRLKCNLTLCSTWAASWCHKLAHYVQPHKHSLHVFALTLLGNAAIAAKQSVQGWPIYTLYRNRKNAHECAVFSCCTLLCQFWATQMTLAMRWATITAVRNLSM